MTDERKRLLPLDPNEHHHSNRKLRIARVTILVTVALERLAFYSLTGNLVLFLNESPYGWESYNAVNASLFFLGLSFVISVFGGWIADTMMGRFKTILIAFLVYIVGYVIFVLLSPIPAILDKATNTTNTTVYVRFPTICLAKNLSSAEGSGGDGMEYSLTTDMPSVKNPFTESCAWLIYISLTVVALATGTIKANIAPFGADQVKGENQQTIMGFFHWFYFATNLGSLIALAAVTYVEQQLDFFWGYLTANVALGLATIIFLLGACTYIHLPPSGSVLTNVCRILREACRMRRKRRSKFVKDNIVPNGVVDTAESVVSLPPPSCLDFAKYRHGGSFHDTLVDDVKKLGKILCVFLALIPYWMVYFQMQTTFLLQGLHMRLNFTNPGSRPTRCNFSLNSNETDAAIIEPRSTPVEIVAAWFSLFDVVFVIILVPFVDRFLYPRLARWSGHPFSMVKRISLGMCFAILAMCVAAVVEMFRLKAYWPWSDTVGPSDPQQCCSHSINQKVGNTVFNASDMSVFWQIPQYALIGVSEVFTVVAGMEFAYLVAPRSMKGIIMGLFYVFSGIGSFLGTGSMYAFDQTWFFGADRGNINCRLPCTENSSYKVDKACHLDFYFFFLAGVGFLGLIFFIIVAKKFDLDPYGSSKHYPRQTSMPGVTEDRRPTNAVRRLR